VQVYKILWQLSHLGKRGAPGGTPGALSFPHFFGHAKKWGSVRAGQNRKACLKLICYLPTSPFALCRRHRRQGLQPMPTQRFGFQQPISRHFTQFIAGDYFLFSCNFCVRIGSRHCRPKEVGKKGNKKRGLRIVMRRSPPLFEITPARRAYRSGGAVYASAPAVASSLQRYSAEGRRFKKALFKVSRRFEGKTSLTVRG